MASASAKGYVEIVKLLVNFGADIDAYRNYSLDFSGSNGRTEVVRLLLNFGASTRYNPLRTASWFGYFDIVKLLVESGVSARDDDNRFLQFSYQNKHYHVAKYLLDHGANPKGLPEESLKDINNYDKFRQYNAMKKIVNWWIPICYDLTRECGKRRMERGWKRIEGLN